MRVSESTSTDEEEIRQRIDQEYRAATFLDECLPPNGVLTETETESQPEDLRNDHGSLSEDAISDVGDTDIDDFVEQMSKEDFKENNAASFWQSDIDCRCLQSSHSTSKRTEPGQNQVANASIINKKQYLKLQCVKDRTKKTNDVTRPEGSR